MRVIKNRFQVGDLVLEKDSGITGIITQVTLKEPATNEDWWYPHETTMVTFHYKVRLFRGNKRDLYYEEHKLTMLSTRQG